MIYWAEPIDSLSVFTNKQHTRMLITDFKMGSELIKNKTDTGSWVCGSYSEILMDQK